MKICSLFSGIGGLELGLEAAGVGKTIWQVEQDAFCRSVLARHWPEARRFEDVKEVSGADFPGAGLVCGGYPCQDLSDCHTRKERPGLDGDRSGLWYEFLRIIEECGPRFAIIENVDGAARKRWVPVIREGLWRAGYLSAPVRLRASDVGAPFVGSRVFVIAKANSKSEPVSALYEEVEKLLESAKIVRADWGQPTSEALGMAHGFSRGVVKNRLRSLGNAVVPACAAVIGEIINKLKKR